MRNKLLLTLAAMLASCATTPELVDPAQPWQGKLYAGDSKAKAAVRGQTGEVIQCDVPAFDQMLCLSKGDFVDLYGAYVYHREEASECKARETEAK